MKKKLKTIRKSSGTSSGPVAATRTPFGTEPSHAKKKTTLILPKALLSALHERSRASGVSVNGLCCHYIHAGIFGTPGVPPPPIIVGQIDGRTVASAAARGGRRTEDRLGEGHRMLDDDGGNAFYADWDVIERFAEVRSEHPSWNWMRIGQHLKLTESEARAADDAIETGALKTYLETRYGTTRR